MRPAGQTLHYLPVTFFHHETGTAAMVVRRHSKSWIVVMIVIEANSPRWVLLLTHLSHDGAT